MMVTQHWCLAYLAAASCLLMALPAHGSSFRIIPNDGLSRKVLLLYDCGFLEGESECLPHEEGFAGPADPKSAESVSYESDDELNKFRKRLESLGLRYQVDRGKKEILYLYPGDEAELRSKINSESPVEVWLLSGGGQLRAGLGVGAALRDKRMVVRVPNAARVREAGLTFGPRGGPMCVSSCTIAFMGGLFRYIDEGATYQVHAASMVLTMNKVVAAEIHERYVKGGMQSVADFFAEDARRSVRNAMVHFHETLLLNVPPSQVQPERERRDRELSEWVVDSSGKYKYLAAQLERDTRLYELEGTAALQDIIMRVERSAINHAMADLRARLPNLGRRADAALEMVEAMYDTSSIQESNVMARETLFKMGYITVDVEEAK